MPGALAVLSGKLSQLLGLGSTIIDSSTCPAARPPGESPKIIENIPKENTFIPKALHCGSNDNPTDRLILEVRRPDL
jgi:hypothetical protein